MRQESGLLYAKATIRKFLKSWAKIPKKTVDFTHNRNLSHIKNHFQYWKNRTLWKLETREKIQMFNENKQIQQKKVFFLIK